MTNSACRQKHGISEMARGHKLYTTEDEDKPDCICDINGEVVLALCRVCGQGECDLEPTCPGTRETTSDLTEHRDNDYLKYRGKCKEMAEAVVADNPKLILVRGHYYCPVWGEQPHWWCKETDGTIVDPTKNQFPSRGMGVYVEFDGMVTCANCGKEMREEDADIDGNYAFCSYECHGRFVGVF